MASIQTARGITFLRRLLLKVEVNSLSNFGASRKIALLFLSYQGVGTSRQCLSERNYLEPDFNGRINSCSCKSQQGRMLHVWSE